MQIGNCVGIRHHLTSITWWVEETMPKNILLFADGTGNEGGLLPDESRTNVYKLYRATRNGPDTRIDPRKQIAFYVHGIGTPTPGQSPRRIKQILEQMFGGGLSSRIIEGYAAIISVWQPGDRIYLFGFSRGAYTVRCLAHVLELFGIPTKEPDAESISLDPIRLHSVCRKAVRILYRFGLIVQDSEKRAKAVKAFRDAYRSQIGAAICATPYFVGVWDTVAAIGWGRFFKNRYDLHFPREVRFARHAMAIDEYRKDFARVKWGGSSCRQTAPASRISFSRFGSPAITPILVAAIRRRNQGSRMSACSGWWISSPRNCRKTPGLRSIGTT